MTTDHARQEGRPPKLDGSNFLLITPKLIGRDGISNVSKQVVDVILSSAQHPQNLRILSLADEKCWFRSVLVEGCGGRKFEMCVRALASTLAPDDDLTVFVMHLHLAPLTFPIASWHGKIVTFLHGVECWKPLTAIQKAALQRSSLLIANSQHTKDRFIDCNPAFRNQEKISVCHLGANPEPHPVKVEKHPSFALMVGRVDANERYKGHDAVLEAWPHLMSDIPSACLTVVGDGTDLPRLRSKAAALGINGAVSFLGSVSEQQLAALYRDCAFFVMPSCSEGFGLVFLEAMRAGKPCIAGQGAAQEVVEDGVTGYIVGGSNPAELSHRMAVLFRDSQIRSKMGLSSQQRFVSYFSAEHFRNRLLAILASRKGEQLCAE